MGMWRLLLDCVVPGRSKLEKGLGLVLVVAAVVAAAVESHTLPGVHV